MGTNAKWTRAQTDLLVREYPNRPTSEVARFVGKPLTATYGKARSLGLRKARRSRVWKPWMTDILRQNYGVTSNDKIASWLGVSKTCVVYNAHALGLVKQGRLRRPRPAGHAGTISPEQGAYIRRMAGELPHCAIAEKTGFSASAITRYCARHGISRYWKPDGEGEGGTVISAGMSFILNNYNGNNAASISSKTGIPEAEVVRLGKPPGDGSGGRKRPSRKPLRWTPVTDGDPEAACRVLAECAVEYGPRAGETEYLTLDYDPVKEYTDDQGHPVGTVIRWMRISDILSHPGTPQGPPASDPAQAPVPDGPFPHGISATR